MRVPLKADAVTVNREGIQGSRDVSTLANQVLSINRLSPTFQCLAVGGPLVVQKTLEPFF